jgi:multiple sugar transport system ATP-binding protein
VSLAIHNVSKQYRSGGGFRPAVRNVTLEARDGELVVLLGPSGCGKTTLLRIIAGLEQPDEGSVRLGGQDITRLEPRRRDLAMVFQSYALYPHMKVAENIGYPLKVRRRPPAEIAAEVERICLQLGLAELRDKRPAQLSGGERQRVALARAIIRKPQAFLMDEPLSNLDAHLRLRLRAELKSLQHQLGIVTLYVTHDQEEAMTLARRIAVLNHGSLQQFGTPSEIYNCPANLFVAGFLGSPPMNILDGTTESGVCHAAGLCVHTTEPQRTAVASRHSVKLGIRPEDIEFSSAPLPGWMSARVWVAEDMGNATVIRAKLQRVRLQNGETDFTVRAPAGVRLNSGDPFWFRIPPEKIHLFDTETEEAIR